MYEEVNHVHDLGKAGQKISCEGTKVCCEISCYKSNQDTNQPSNLWHLCISRGQCEKFNQSLYRDKSCLQNCPKKEPRTEILHLSKQMRPRYSTFQDKADRDSPPLKEETDTTPFETKDMKILHLSRQRRQRYPTFQDEGCKNTPPSKKKGHRDTAPSKMKETDTAPSKMKVDRDIPPFETKEIEILYLSWQGRQRYSTFRDEKDT